MERVLWAGVGGFVGASLRYAVGGWVARVPAAATFPWSTLAINVAGCLAIGALAALAETRGLFAGASRAFVFAGVLGGFTTFSAFGLETFHLLRAGQAPAAAASVAMQLALGLGAVWAGDALVRAVTR
jgi:CrcB protein